MLDQLQDDDPYVRKTAAVCVAKLFDINAELVEDRGFLDMLRVRELKACFKSRHVVGCNSSNSNRCTTTTAHELPQQKVFKTFRLSISQADDGGVVDSSRGVCSESRRPQSMQTFSIMCA